MRLSRDTGSEYRFRIIETWGYNDQPSVEDSTVIDFDTRNAALIPIYADPVGQRGMPPPLEIVLEENHNLHRYVFINMQDLLLFQQAITGFKVVENYME